VTNFRSLRTGLPFRSFSHIQGLRTVTSHNQPSCRYLSPRVLTRLSYDAYWLRQALDVSTSKRPLLNRPKTACAIFNYSLSDFGRLQGINQMFSSGWEPDDSLWVFFPFSAFTASPWRPGSPPPDAPRSQVFATSQQVLYGSAAYRFIPPC